MAKNVWLCGKCSGAYEDRSEAMKCEFEHEQAFKELKIIGADYRDVSKCCGVDRRAAAIIPSHVRIKWGDESNYFSTYKIVSTGRQGL